MTSPYLQRRLRTLSEVVGQGNNQKRLWTAQECRDMDREADLRDVIAEETGQAPGDSFDQAWQAETADRVRQDTATIPGFDSLGHRRGFTPDSESED